ncbi:MAG: M1 family metallopeptidase, partial [Cytophagales bacterium]|nr:M1 family metallopeptidase [Cytophagales bacterium]
RPWSAVACEGKGASLWWPCKDHPSDEPDSMQISIGIPTSQVEMGDSVVSNGNLQSVISEEDGYTSFVWKVHYPINSYNVTYYIGPYQHVADTNQGLRMDYYVADTKLSKAIPHLRQSKEMLQCFEKLFGPYPFPLDGYALVESPYWGMEHQSAIAYGNGFKNNAWGFDFIIVHESAHEWWGNSVSCSDHAELWIHESFATYAEALYVEYQWGKQKMIEYLLEQKKRIKNSEPMVGPLGVNYNNWQDSDEYFKGTWMLHTLRNMVDNDSLWFASIKGLAVTFRYQVVTTKQVVDFMSKSLKMDLQPFFEQYLYKRNPPTVEYYWKTEKGVQMLYYRLVSDVKALKMRLRAGKANDYKIKLLAESQWKKMAISDRTDFVWAEDLFYIIPKEVIP